MKYLLLFTLLSSELMAFTQMNVTNPIVDCTETPEIIQKKHMVHDLVESYQGAIKARYGYGLTLSFTPSGSCTHVIASGGHNRQGKLVIDISPGVVHQLSRESVVFVLCHELGHVLGSIKPADTQTPSRYDPRDAIEGEADYFGGSCTRNYLALINSDGDSLKNESYCKNQDENCQRTLTAARLGYRAIYGNIEIKPKTASKQAFLFGNGINPNYPDPNCRLFSVITGMLEQPRPKCWYNPISERQGN